MRKTIRILHQKYRRRRLPVATKCVVCGDSGPSVCPRCLNLAKTGLEAVIDEATGYQDVRPKDALRQRYKERSNDKGK